jgi:hypothetical protein
MTPRVTVASNAIRNSRILRIRDFHRRFGGECLGMAHLPLARKKPPAFRAAACRILKYELFTECVCIPVRTIKPQVEGDGNASHIFWLNAVEALLTRLTHLGDEASNLGLLKRYVRDWR